MAKRKIKYLSPEQIQRGIYIDFECLQDQAPSVLGVLIDGAFQQYVLDDRLKEGALYSKCEFMELNALIGLIYEWANSENRYLVAWSTHELNVIQQFAGLNVSDRYYNAKYGAKRWRRKKHPKQARAVASLSSFMVLTGYLSGAGLGKGNAAARLRYVLNQLKTRGSFDKLTPVAKRKMDHETC